MQRVTSSLLVVMLARPQSLGMLCLWGGIPRGGVSVLLLVALIPLCLMSLPILVSSAPQVALPGGTDGCRALLGLPRGYLHWQARACMCTVGHWPRAHNISLHPSTLMLEGAHAAEVRGDSAAITLYWSEGVRSNIHSHNLCDHRSDRFAHTHIALCVCARGVAHLCCAVVCSGLR